jgi:hypothetical protein
MNESNYIDLAVRVLDGGGFQAVIFNDRTESFYKGMPHKSFDGALAECKEYLKTLDACVSCDLEMIPEDVHHAGGESFCGYCANSGV